MSEQNVRTEKFWQIISRKINSPVIKLVYKLISSGKSHRKHLVMNYEKSSRKVGETMKNCRVV